MAIMAIMLWIISRLCAILKLSRVSFSISIGLMLCALNELIIKAVNPVIPDRIIMYFVINSFV